MIQKITVNNFIWLYLLLLLISISTNAMTSSLSNKEETGHGMDYFKLADLRLYSPIIENGYQPTKQHIITQGVNIPNTPTVGPCTSQIIVSAGSSISATVSGNNISSGYTTQFILLDNSNVIVSGPQATGTFIASTVGQFKIVAVNYSGILTGLSTGQNIQNITGACYEISAPKCFNVQASSCTSSTSIVIGNSLTVTSTGNNTAVGYTTQYVLTDAGDIVVMGPSSTSSFTPTTMGSYRIYAYNYSGTVSNISVGTNFQTGLTGSCLSKSLPKCFVVVGAPDLETILGQPIPSPLAGQSSFLPVTVKNTGTASTSGSITEIITIPAGTTFGAFLMSSNNNGWTCSVTTATTATCTNPIVLTATTGITTFSVPFIPGASQVGTTLTLRGDVSGGSEPSTNVNAKNTSFVTTPMVAAPSLTVAKSVQSGVINTNTNYTYTLAVGNSGSAPTSGVITLKDTLQANLVFIQGVGTGWTCSAFGQIVTCNSSASIAVSGTSSVTLTVSALQAGAYSNRGGVYGGSDPVAVDKNSAKQSNTVMITIVINAVKVTIKAFLKGPYVQSSGLMQDSLRAQGIIPLTQPYGKAPYTDITHTGVDEVTTSSVLSVTGNNAIVDWVMVELRDKANSSNVLYRRAGLIQRDGDIVDVDGINCLTFIGVVSDSYYIAIRHRNHLGVMTATPVSLTSTCSQTLDFSNSSIAIYKKPTSSFEYTAYPQAASASGVMTMWAGNTTPDTYVIFQGPNNDTDPIFNRILTDAGNTGGLTNYAVYGYLRQDINLNGSTVYQGPGNEVDVLFNEIFNHPENSQKLTNFVIYQQLP